jgi:hypothetical protein
MQTKQAKAIRRSARSVQRYRAECERAELIETHHGPIVREADGTVHRAWTNRYVFCVPPGAANRKKSSSGRHAKSVGTNSTLTSASATSRNEYDHMSGRIPGPAPWHDECGGTRWLEQPNDEVRACSCL